MTPPPYALARVGVPDDLPALPAIDLSLERAGPRLWMVEKLPLSASLSPDQYAREETVAEVIERRQHARGGATSPTTRPLARTSSTEPPRPENFLAPATAGNSSSRPLPRL
jgi:hypothetical protein